MQEQRYIIIAYHSGYGYEINDKAKELEMRKLNEGSKEIQYLICEVEIKKFNEGSEKIQYLIYTTDKGYKVICLEFNQDMYQYAKQFLKKIIEEYKVNENNCIAFLHGRDSPFSNDYKLEKIPTKTFSGDDSYAYHILDLVFNKEGYQGKEYGKERGFPDWETNIIEVKKKDVINPFFLLKHRIAHLFLAMDIDLQGIDEVKRQKGEARAKEYLNEVLKEHESNANYYRQKLADLWYILTRRNDFELVTPSSNAEQLLANGRAIIDLVNEYIKSLEDRSEEPDDREKKKREIKDCWEKLLKICGLKYNNSNPFDATQIQPDKNSAIFKFMGKLDERVENQNCDNIDNILKFKELDDILTSDFLPLKSEVSFHNWFCALDDCLQKLRDRIK